MKVKFANKNLETLCTKGCCSTYKQLSNKALRQIVSALTIAESITDIAELTTPPLFSGGKNTDGSITLYLCEEWVLQMSVKISGEGNTITLNSLCQIAEEEAVNG